MSEPDQHGPSSSSSSSSSSRSSSSSSSSIRLNLVNLVRCGCGGLFLASVIAVLPLIGIRPGEGLLPWQRAWQESAFCLLSVISGALAGVLYASLPDLGRPIFTRAEGRYRLLVNMIGWAQPYLLPAGKCLFAFLFVSAIVLCQRLRLGLVWFEPELLYFYRNFGLVVFLAAAIRLANQLATKYGARRKSSRSVITHPIYLSALLAFVGAPMIFATWLPLIALPGIFVIMKWIIYFEEASSPLALLNSDADNNGGGERRWRLVPYLF